MPNQDQNQTRTAFITITGRPNVGKSTLLNALVGEKISIISKKPQTTRNRITGVLTEGPDQYVFFDTPGLITPKNLLGEYMMKAAGAANRDADAFLFVTDARLPLNTAERKTFAALASPDKNRANALIINKTDVTDKGALLKYIAEMTALYNFDAVIPVSALTGDGLSIIKTEIKKFLFASPHFFPEDYATDQPERQIVAEIIREKVLRLTDEEIPHGVAVKVEEFSERKSAVYIRAELFVEKSAHKKMIIGKDGAMLKRIGTYAREDIEQILHARVYLDIWVKHRENWRDRPAYLNSFGYAKGHFGNVPQAIERKEKF